MMIPCSSQMHWQKRAGEIHDTSFQSTAKGSVDNRKDLHATVELTAETEVSVDTRDVFNVVIPTHKKETMLVIWFREISVLTKTIKEKTVP